MSATAALPVTAQSACDPVRASSRRDVERLGQVFTPPHVVELMLGLRRHRDPARTLEPSAGDGAFARRLPGCTAIELDATKAPPDALVMDFFDYPDEHRFDTIIGNPPYVRAQDILPATRQRLRAREALNPEPMFDGRSNLYLHFIEKAVRHLNPGGELIFIVPREFIKLTAARRLNAFLAEEGTVTDFIETGDARIFRGATPNCVIFRFERGRLDHQLDDGRQMRCIGGQLVFVHPRSADGAAASHELRLGDIFDVRVGAVTGADALFAHPDGRPFVCSRTATTGGTRTLLFPGDAPHPALLPHKEVLLARRIRRFTEADWWHWGRLHALRNAPRIYVNAKTRARNPFFLHACNDYDGSVLALFPQPQLVTLPPLEVLVARLNAIDWASLGFVCDGRFLFGQRSLAGCRVPIDLLLP